MELVLRIPALFRQQHPQVENSSMFMNVIAQVSLDDGNGSVATSPRQYAVPSRQSVSIKEEKPNLVPQAAYLDSEAVNQKKDSPYYVVFLICF